MFFDEDKIRKRAAQMGVGPKGVFPQLNKFHKPRNPHERTVEILRIVIGFCLTAGLIAGVGILIYTIVSGGTDYAETLKKRDSNKEYIEVIFKPKSDKTE